MGKDKSERVKVVRGAAFAFCFLLSALCLIALPFPISPFTFRLASRASARNSAKQVPIGIA
jgi:hypothetical protein